jgi:hypothetical protein
MASFFFWEYSRHLPFCSTLRLHASEAHEFGPCDPYYDRLASIVTPLHAGIVACPSGRIHWQPLLL